LAVQPYAPAGHAQTEATAPWQTSPAEAETRAELCPHCGAAEIAQVIAGAVVSTTWKGNEHLEDMPEATDVATHWIIRPLFADDRAMETVPSRFSTQPTAPAGHEHTTRGATGEHKSEPEAEKVLVRLGLHSTAAAGPEQVMVGGTGVMDTTCEQVPTLPEQSVAEKLRLRPLFAYTEARDTLLSSLTTQP
jgi:hypothetical protein